MESTRVPQWPSILSDYVRQLQNDPFDYGEHDCCTFVAGAVAAITGQPNLMAPYVGLYTTMEEGEEVIGAPIAEFLQQHFGDPVSGLQGCKGDIAMFEGACGIIISGMAIFLHEQGYGYLKLSRIDAVYKVPQ